ncbi:MAG: DUF6273 domain-containing protein [Turicibacter sp.]|nr:DUF6273 domain-containing protein [Turicibacter sp.]
MTWDELVLESNTAQNAITWENCTLRHYLNNDFYNKFSDNDKSRIAQRTIANNDNPWFGIAGGSNTNDNIFLLSIEEVARYLGDGNLARLPMSADEKFIWDDSGMPNDANKLKLHKEVGYPNHSFFIDLYGNPKRVAKDISGAATWWWLRSPGSRSFGVAFVLDAGVIALCNSDHMLFVKEGFFPGVRPALWLNL